MKRSYPGDDKVDVFSSGESSPSDADTDAGYYGRSNGRFSSNSSIFERMPKELSSEDALMKKAEMYQQYMKQVPIPTHRGSVIPFTSWMGLGKSVKQLYGQPLHYLTNVLLKQWDQERIGSEDEHQPLDSIIHPCKAEATIWLIEEIHRWTSSSHHIAKLWLSDPMHDAYIDSVTPNLGS